MVAHLVVQQRQKLTLPSGLRVARRSPENWPQLSAPLRRSSSPSGLSTRWSASPPWGLASRACSPPRPAPWRTGPRPAPN